MTTKLRLRLLDLKDRIGAQWAELTLELSDLARELKDDIAFNDTELQADAAAIFKRVLQEVSALKTALNKAADTSQKIAALQFIRDLQAGFHTDTSLSTPWGKHTPNVKLAPKVPHRDEPAFEALIDSLVTCSEARSRHALRPHWPTVVELSTERAANGLPHYSGFDPSESLPKYSLTTRLNERKMKDDREKRLKHSDVGDDASVPPGDDRGGCDGS